MHNWEGTYQRQWSAMQGKVKEECGVKERTENVKVTPRWSTQKWWQNVRSKKYWVLWADVTAQVKAKNAKGETSTCSVNARIQYMTICHHFVKDYSFFFSVLLQSSVETDASFYSTLEIIWTLTATVQGLCIKERGASCGNPSISCLFLSHHCHLELALSWWAFQK